MTYTLVMRLMETANLFHKGHHLGIDNYFTSPALLYDLYTAHVSATGTVRKNRKGLPKTVTLAKLANKNVMERRRGQRQDAVQLPTARGKKKRVPRVIKLYN